MNIKKIIISAATVAAFVAAGTIAYCTSEKNQEKDLIQANYEALLDGEGGGGSSECFIEYERTWGSRVFICGECEWVRGKGTRIGGICVF